MRILALLAGVVLLQGCSTAAKARAGEVRVTKGQLRDRWLEQPGAGAGTITYFHDALYVQPSFEKMNELYAKTSWHPHKHASAWDCDKAARLASIEVARMWAETGAELPLAQGVISGILPLDGDNEKTGPHMLNWFMDDKGKLWLRGALEREIFTQPRLGAVGAIGGIIEIWLVQA